MITKIFSLIVFFIGLYMILFNKSKHHIAYGLAVIVIAYLMLTVSLLEEIIDKLNYI